LFHLPPCFCSTHAVAVFAVLAKENPGRLFTFTRWMVDKFIKRYGAIAGIPEEKCHVHAIKHASAMVFWKASGGNLGLLQRHLGHKSVSSSLIYLYESDAQKASAIMSAVRM
jgi:integrase